MDQIVNSLEIMAATNTCKHNSGEDAGTSEVTNSLHKNKKDDDGGDNLDCVVMAVAKKIARDLSPNESISLADFERRATEAYQGLEDPEEETVVG